MTMADIIELSSGSEEEDSVENYEHRRPFRDIWRIAIKTIPMAIEVEPRKKFPYDDLKTTLSNVMKKLSLVTHEQFKDFVFTRLLQLLQTVKFAYDGIGDEEKINFLLIDFMASYINFKCGRYYSPDERISVTNKILMILHVLFSGKSHLIIMTMLRVKSNTVCAHIVYQIFKKYIYGGKVHNTNDLATYLRLILLARKWKYIDNISTLETEAEIDLTCSKTLTDEIQKYLPDRVPLVDELNRPFTGISDLIGFAIRRGDKGTSILLENKSMNLNETIERFFRQYENLINSDDTLNTNESIRCLKPVKTSKKPIPLERTQPTRVELQQTKVIESFEKIPMREKLSAIGKMDVTLSASELDEQTEASDVILSECDLEEQAKESELTLMECDVYDDINESDLFMSSYDNDSPALPGDELLSQDDISILTPSIVQDENLHQNIDSPALPEGELPLQDVSIFTPPTTTVSNEKFSSKDDSPVLPGNDMLSQDVSIFTPNEKFSPKNDLSNSLGDELLLSGDLSTLPMNIIEDHALSPKKQLASISKCEYTIEHKINIFESQMTCIDKNLSLKDLVNRIPLDSNILDRLEVKRFSLEIAKFYRYNNLAIGNSPISDTTVSTEMRGIVKHDMQSINYQAITTLEEVNQNMLTEVSNSQNTLLPKPRNPFFPGTINISQLPANNLSIREYNPRSYAFKFNDICLRKFALMTMPSSLAFRSNLVQLVTNLHLQRRYSLINPFVSRDKQNMTIKKKVKKVTFKLEANSSFTYKKSNNGLSNPETAKSKTYVSILRRNFKKAPINKNRIAEPQSSPAELEKPSDITSTITDVQSSSIKILFADKCKEKRLMLNNIFRNKISKVSRRALSFEEEVETDKGRENEASITNSIKRKSESKNTVADLNRKKRKKISSEGNVIQPHPASQHNWIAEENLLKECLSNLKLEKLSKEIDVLLKHLMNLAKTSSLEAYFVINKIMVIFIYECLLSLDYSRITLRKYLGICSKAKKLQAKNIDNLHLYEIESKYEELKTNIHNPSIIYNLDLVLNALRDVKKELFSEEWQQKNKNKIQKYMYLEPVELTFSSVRGTIKSDNIQEKQAEILSRETLSYKSPLKSEQRSNDSSNIQKLKVSPINTARSPRSKFDDGLQCADVSFCDFVGEYGSSLGSSNLDFMPDEIKLDGPIIPFPQNSGNFNDILEHSLSEADISSLSDNDTNDNFFSNQTLEANILDDTEFFCTARTVDKKTNLAYTHDPINQSFEITESLLSNRSDASIKTSRSSYVTQNDRNLISNPFWKNVIGGPNTSTCRTIARTKD